jgi:hypothetical protein
MFETLQAGSLAGILSLTLAAVLAFGGTDWIERRFDLFPDGGNGLLEFVFVAIALAIGASLLVRAPQDYACMQSSHHRERTLPE